jgi:uncharacterized membrane protein YtjA (UPF0391 family)
LSLSAGQAAVIDRPIARPNIEVGDHRMLQWALIFLVVALIAGVLGFGGIASASAGIAKVLFFIFLILFVAGLIAHMVRGRA